MKKYYHMISEDIYRRVYRLMKQRIDPPLIAAAVNLPLSAILHVIGRLEKKPELAGSESEGAPLSTKYQKESGSEVFLDVYYFTKPKYSIVQLVGHIVAGSKPVIEREFHKIRTSVWKSIALQMAEVTAMDETGAAMVLDLCKEIKSHERYIALLAPSVHIESVIEQYKMEELVPIFGTTNAYEKGASSYRPTDASSRGRGRHLLT
jgi:anti-anti-sigma regulatory factor